MCIGDSGWSSLDAAVVCNQLKMGSQGKNCCDLLHECHIVHPSQELFPGTTTLWHHLPCWLLTAQGTSLLCSTVHSLCAMLRTTTMLE